MGASKKEKQAEKGKRREETETASFNKGKLELKDRVKVRNDLLTDVAKVSRTNRDDALSRQQIRQQGGWYGHQNRGQRSHHGREKFSEDDRRRKEERLREQLRQKEEKVNERLRQKEEEQKLKEKLRMQQKMG